MNNKMQRLSLVCLAATAFAVASGCAQQEEDINRVQNNVTKKAELRGEFYFRSTVVAAPYASVDFFTGLQNWKLERGVFEITQKTLYFYRTYEHIIGGETLGAAADIDTPVYKTDTTGALILGADGKPQPVTYERRIGDQVYTVARYVYRGSAVVAFPIQGHFDVQRGYSAVTGEETNEIVENTSDREWYERDYMRVGWGAAQNSYADEAINATMAEHGSGMALVETVDEQAAANEVPVKKYRADGTLDYFDYLTNVTVGAPVSWYDDGETQMYIPTCFYYPWYLGQVAECVSEKITRRQAFMRVQPSDYVGWDYDNTLMKKFGFFRVERASYDTTRGVTYSGASRRIQRFRIWDKYVVKKGNACTAPGGDVSAKANGCADGEVCDQVGEQGLFCVKADPNDRLDYAQMTATPVVYSLSEQFPRDLVPETVILAKRWSVPLVDAVKARKADPGHEMFVLCENNMDEATAAMTALGLDINKAEDVKKAQADGNLAQIGGFCCKSRLAGETDTDGTCSLMKMPKRNGDIRFSQISSVNAPMSYGLYGYGPSAADPMTGENLSANAYNYTPAMWQGAARAMRAMQLLTGIDSYWDTIYSNDIIERATKTRLGAAQGGMPKWTEESAAAAAKDFLSPEVQTALDTVGLQTADGSFAADRMAMLAKAEPSIAKMLVTEDTRLLLRDPTVGQSSKEPTDQQLQRLGMHTWGHRGGQYKKTRDYYKSQAMAGCRYIEEFADNALLGLAREYADIMNKRVCEAAAASTDGIFDFTEFDKLKGTCASAGAEKDGLVCKEVTYDDKGTKGLFWSNPCGIGKLKAQIAAKVFDLEQTNPYTFEKNFYPPDPLYTDTKIEAIQKAQVLMIQAIEAVRTDLLAQLRKRIYLGVAEHEVGHTLGLRHNFEGSTDAMNFGAEFWKLKGEFDGKGNFNAADKFSGETFYQAANNMRTMQFASIMDYGAKFNSEFSGVGHYDRAAIKFGYGGTVEVFNKSPDVARFEKFMEDPVAEDPSNIATVAEAKPYLERLFKSRVHYAKIPELFSSIEDLYDRSDVPMSAMTTSEKDGAKIAKTADGKWEVPFRFCSDEVAGGLPTCDVFDEGADPFEIVRNRLSDYEAYWPIVGHWHDSVLFAPDRYYGYVLGAFVAVQMQMQWWVTERQRFDKGGWWQKRFGKEWKEDDLGGRSGMLAIIDSVNMMTQAFGRPEPGTHGYRAARDVWEPIPYQDNVQYNYPQLITPQNCDARQFYPGWDYDGYLPKATSAGSIYDRLAAFQVLSEPSVGFMATDTNNDVQKYLISYYSLFPKELQNLFGGMLANKANKWGWWMQIDKDGKPTNCLRRNIVGPQAVDPAPGTAWPFNPEPQYTFPTTRFRLPMLAAYYGLGLFLTTYDHSFVDTTRVFIEGHENAITPTADADVLSFPDPLSGKVYTATRAKDRPDLVFPAYEMVQALQKEFESYGSLKDLQENYNKSEYQYILDKLELLRGMNHVYDYSGGFIN